MPGLYSTIKAQIKTKTLSTYNPSKNTAARFIDFTEVAFLSFSPSVLKSNSSGYFMSWKYGLSY